MSTPMPDQDLNLDRLEALANAATEGPWWYTPTILGLPNTTVMGGDGQIGYAAVGTFLAPNAEFIAASRTAIPDLIAEVRRLRAQAERVLELHDRDVANRARAEAEALREAADAFSKELGSNAANPGPKYVVGWLHNRAAKLEKNQ